MEYSIYLMVIIACLLIVYNYCIYPMIVILLSKIYSVNHLVDMTYTLTVSVIIAAYNEESVIRRKIENTLSLNYPKDKLQIIVVSDGSNDRTADIVKEYESVGIVSLHNPERAGKSAALNRAVEHASGMIIIFSDANNDYSTNAVLHLVSHFIDPLVGAVTGSKRIYSNHNRESAQGDGMYWRYESAIKASESKLGSITAAEGEIFAVRKNLFKPIPVNYINDDAAITFSIIKSGHRVLYDSNAIAYEDASISLVDDFYVKVRMASGGYQTFFRELSFLIPPRSLFAVFFLSHKLLRWLSPHFLLVIFIGSAFLANNWVMLLLLIVQIIFYITAWYGWNRKSDKSLSSIFYIPMYFCSMNAAMFWGFIKYVTGSQSVNWRKAKR